VADTPLDSLKNLSPRARAGLRAAGLETLEAACALTDEELLKLKGVQAASLTRLRLWQANPGGAEPPSGRAGTPAGRGQGLLHLLGQGSTDPEVLKRVWELYVSLTTGPTPIPPVQAMEKARNLEGAFRAGLAPKEGA
jgi:hypothetical protein